MNKKRKFSKFYFLLAVLILMGISDCKNNSETLVPLSGSLMKYEGCKQSTANDERSNDIQSSNADDCLEYNYDGAGNLTIKHVNCCFNCCPGTISADFTYNGNQITITEKESAQDCRCSCLYDLYYEIKNVPPGSHIVRIIEPNINETDAVMAFTLELFSAKSGTFCVPRNHYPW
ncbi:MAG: hypothetical protein MUF15_09545 [Acidobacteria bacterium]|nr:hypothetical protein [Acidobacteriota bacterium]